MMERYYLYSYIQIYDMYEVCFRLIKINPAGIFVQFIHTIFKKNYLNLKQEKQQQQ